VSIEFQPGETVGIDLGTTFCSLARVDADGNPVAIANDEGLLETPSVVLLLEGGRVIVGPSRARAALEPPDHVVQCVKRTIGEPGGVRAFHGQQLTPEFLSALILKKLRQDAEKRIGPIGNAVITVPYYFNDARRHATENAGRIAGLNVVDIINEPTAATLTYAWHRGELGAGSRGDAPPRTALVYDLGGGTFDATVVRYTPAHFRVLATDGDVHLGGVDWTERLVDYVADEFRARHAADPRHSPAALQVLRNDCDAAKIDLSARPQTTIVCRHGGKAASVPVRREQFEALTADLLQRTADTTELVLGAAGVKAGELDAVVMVGGATLMPQASRMLAKLCGQAPYQGLSPYTAVAQGAALHAAILAARQRGAGDPVGAALAGVRQENVNSHGLGVLAADPRLGQEINQVLIPRNSRLPAEVRRVFHTQRAGQTRVSVQVIEGDAPDPRACALLGKCRIVGLPAGLPQGAPIEVCCALDEAGRVRVSARDCTTGRAAAIVLDRRSGLSPAALDAYTHLAAQYEVQ
jgi:molecular chaperone DnaK